MAEGYARASGRVGVAIATSGPGATNLVTRDRRRLDGLDADRLHHRPGALEPDRHRRLPGDRRDRDHDADRQALLARAGRARAAARDQGRLPRRPHRPRRARCSSTSPRTSRRPSSTSPTPTRSTCPAGGRRPKVHERQVARGREGDRRVARSRSSTPAAACINADASRRAARARRGGPAAGRRDADGRRAASPTRTRSTTARPGMHGSKYAELGAQQVPT